MRIPMNVLTPRPEEESLASKQIPLIYLILFSYWKNETFSSFIKFDIKFIVFICRSDKRGFANLRNIKYNNPDLYGSLTSPLTL